MIANDNFWILQRTNNVAVVVVAGRQSSALNDLCSEKEAAESDVISRKILICWQAFVFQHACVIECSFIRRSFFVQFFILLMHCVALHKDPGEKRIGEHAMT